MLELDALDHRILTVLQQDAGLSNAALAVRVHASEPTCLRRVRRLREHGVINRVVALLDPAVLGEPLTAIVEVSLDRQGAEAWAAFEAKADGEPAILQCYRVGAGVDYVLVVTVRDMAAYQGLVQRFLGAVNNVRNVRTLFSVARSKFGTAWWPPLGPDAL
ncbi:MAG: Lrp/AsnC family transcriptional regulator [Pigmentiphaga sp.]